MKQIKRSASFTPTPPSSPSESKPDVNLSPGKKAKTNGKTPASPSKQGVLSSSSRGEILDEIIAAGVKHVDLDHLAQKKHGVTRTQLQAQFKPNRANLRAKAVKAVQEL